MDGVVAGWTDDQTLTSHLAIGSDGRVVGHAPDNADGEFQQKNASIYQATLEGYIRNQLTVKFLGTYKKMPGYHY